MKKFLLNLLKLMLVAALIVLGVVFFFGNGGNGDIPIVAEHLAKPVHDIVGEGPTALIVVGIISSIVLPMKVRSTPGADYKATKNSKHQIGLTGFDI
jgi:amino acid permease